MSQVVSLSSLLIRLTLGYLLLLLVGASICIAEEGEENSLLQDKNGDGIVKLLFFGDSLTFGVGDGIEPGEFIDSFTQSFPQGGYPKRIASFLNVPVTNAGVPGEELTTGGVKRIPSVVFHSSSDIVGILEGANDGFRMVETAEYRRALQRAINVTVALGKAPFLMTIPQPCCNHAGSSPFVASFNHVVRNLIVPNDLKFADLAHAWETTCQNPEACELFNLPEGLHPNTVGYDVIAQTVLATLLGIDIFAATGAKDLESALGLPAGTVIVQPDTGGAS